MRALRLIFSVALVAVIIYLRVTSVPTTTASSASSATPVASSAEVSGGIPQKAIDVLQIVRSTGQPPEGYVGGRVFENREGRLPADGDYREFDVDPHNGNRNAERIIVEWNTKKAWYTGDHYQTFVPLP